MMQNRPANAQRPIVHDVKPSCKHSRADCRCHHTGLKSNKTHLFILYLIKLKSFIRKFVHSFPVGAYRIRPDVSERATYSHKTLMTDLDLKRENPVIIQDSLFFNGTFFNPNSPYNSLTLNNIRKSYCCC